MDAHAIESKETTPASRKLSRTDARGLFREASRLYAIKGRNVREFTRGKDAEKEAVEAMLGPTGNLRAPCIRVGKTVVVGFDEEIYGKTLL